VNEFLKALRSAVAGKEWEKVAVTNVETTLPEQVKVLSVGGGICK
jgi:hypothetical protein